ncbi:MAG: hypothetical protein HYZ36_08625 [Pedosphaera parvula]|nr:hypothetical protein [Pedosphaera parvula]
MKPNAISHSAARHALAGMCSAFFLAAVQLVVFAALKTIDIISYRDLTHGLNLMSAVLLACCFGTAAALGHSLIAGVFALVDRKIHLPVWCPPLLVFVVSTLAAFAIGWSTHGHLSMKLLALAGLLGTAFSMGFGVYWLTVQFSSPLIDWLRGKPSAKKEAN